jgi:hypothetical protein
MKAASTMQATTRTSAGISNAPRHARISWLYVKELPVAGNQGRTS